ncbi:uncharacterized protein V6R79_009037 [Siganus canaliculatus]
MRSHKRENGAGEKAEGDGNGEKRGGDVVSAAKEGKFFKLHLGLNKHTLDDEALPGFCKLVEKPGSNSGEDVDRIERENTAIQVILLVDILAMVLNSKTWGHSSLVTELCCSLSSGSLRVNGEDRRGMQVRLQRGGSGGGRRGYSAALPLPDHRGRPTADSDVTV